MKETESHFSQIESPATGGLLSPGQSLIKGWVMPKPGGHIVDVRAKIADRTFPAIYGIPRADLAAHFQTGKPVALAEFYVVVEINHGPVEIVLEALEIEGSWIAFDTLSFEIDAKAAPANIPQPSGPLRWHEYGRALETLLRIQRRHPDRSIEELAGNLADSIPFPRDLRHPHLPFHGHLDEPAALTRCGFGRTAVLGHLFHESLPIKRVLATFDLQLWQTIEHQTPSPGPAAFYPQFANAANCGLFGIIDVPAQIPNPVCLRLYAEMEDGSLHLCSVQRSHLFTNEDEKAPYPPLDTSSLADTSRALDASFAKRHIEIVRDEEFLREIARINTEYSLRAPRTLSSVPPLQAGPRISTAPLPERVLLLSHNLNFEGAPLFLVDYAQHLASLGSKLTLLSPEDGPLRSRFEQCGVHIHLIETSRIFAARSREEAEREISELARTFDFPGYDLVVANTFTTFWGVHAAKSAGNRVLLYVHESTTPASFYIGRMHSTVIELVNEAFDLADCVSFTTASTRNYHTDYGKPERHRLTPGWIDVSRIDHWLTQHSRDSLRNRFGMQSGELLVTNIGTVCDRKGQHIFVRAVDLLHQRYPELAARTRFIMLGGGDTPFDAVLTDLLAQANRSNLFVHASTSDYLPYYAAADLFVCSTYEESSPRVILETMVCQTPLLSSAVHGVPEQVRDGLEATLIPPGDTTELCENMAKLLLNPERGNFLAKKARARVISEFDASILLPRHVALAAEVAAGII